MNVSLTLLDRYLLPGCLAALPLLLVFAFTPPTTAHPQLAEYLEHFFVLVAVVAVWNVMRHCLVASARLREQSTKRPDRNLWDLAKESALVILPSIGVMGFLLPFKVRFEDQGFYLLLAAMVLEALADSMRMRGRSALSIYPTALARPVYSYLAFQAALPAWSWQPAVISSALGVLLAAVDVVPFLKKVSAKSKPELPNRIFALLLMAGPTLIGAMVYIGNLPKFYLLAFLLLPLIIKVVTAANAHGSTVLVMRAASLIPLGFYGVLSLLVVFW